jgi:hypothetical protein
MAFSKYVCYLFEKLTASNIILMIVNFGMENAVKKTEGLVWSLTNFTGLTQQGDTV